MLLTTTWTLQWHCCGWWYLEKVAVLQANFKFENSRNTTAFACSRHFHLVSSCHWIQQERCSVPLAGRNGRNDTIEAEDVVDRLNSPERYNSAKKKSKKWKWSRWRNEGNLCNMHARISMVKISDVSVIYATFFFMTGLGLTILKQHNPERKRVVSPRVPDRAWSPKHREQHPSVAISQKHWSPEVDKKWGQIKKWWADRLTVKLW